MLRHAAIAIFFLGLCWCAHFTRAPHMGFYEDDHFFAVATLNWTPVDAVRWSWNQVRNFPLPQGRPVGFALGRVLPYIGYRAGGIDGMYAIGWLILSLNAVLLFHLLRRCLPDPLPMIGAIGFVFFPPDTTRPFLCHAHILQPSITFTLLACHFYLAKSWRWRTLAYLVAGCALLTYETALLPFIVFPLLQRKWDRAWLRAFGIHLLTLAMLAGLLTDVRKAMGESRVVQANENVRTIATQIVEGTPIGIDTSLLMCRMRAEQGWEDFSIHREAFTRRNMILAALVMGTAVFGSVRFSSKPVLRYSEEPDRAAEDPARRSTPETGFGRFRSLLLSLTRATAFGLAGLSIAYVFCFTHFPPDFRVGRMTSTHLAATFPIAVLMAVIASLPMLIPQRTIGAILTCLIAAAYFGLIYGADIDAQRDYVNIWNARRNFWTQVLDLCPDMTDRTLVVIDGGVPREWYYMESSSWSDYMVLYQSFQFPSAFKRPPMAFCFRPEDNPWQKDAIHTSTGKIAWKPNPFGTEPVETADDGNLILLHAEDAAHLTRDRGTITLAGQTMLLREPPPVGTRCPFPTLPLYHILTGRQATLSQ